MFGYDKRVTKRPWGKFVTLISTRKFTAKFIVVSPGQSLSLQYHKHRDEFWVWVDGPAPRITIDDMTFYMENDRHYAIPRGVKHRIENPQHSDNLADHTQSSVVLEIATGRFDENDVVRLKDKYGRA